MSHRVPAEGPLDAKIAILGESPGKNEWAKGRPFIGESGDILNDALRAVGLRRRDVYITNVIKDHLPPWGDRKKSFFFKGEVATQEYLEGIRDVMLELQEVRPNVVVPMGNYALWAMRQHEGIMKWRGSILESRILPGQKIVPTLHPAFFINSRIFWHRLPLFEWDFQKAVRQSTFPEIVLPNPEIIVDPSPEQMRDAVDRFSKADYLICDTEWYGPNDLAYIGFSDSKDYAFVIPFTSQFALRAYRDIMGSGVPIVSQNGWAFDIPGLWRQGIEVANPSDDTMVMWNCCWASLRAKGLDTLSSVLTDHPYYKEDVEFVGRDDELGQYYCGTDCVVTTECFEKIRDEEFPITKADKGYEITKSAFPYFIEATKQGILIDDELRREMKAAHLETADRIEDALGKTIGHSINCRSSKQVINFLFDRLFPMYKIKRTKRTSKQDYLMDIAGSCGINDVQMILGAIIRVRQNRNIVSRYLHDGIVDTDGRARTNWNLAGTRSGRFSATKPWWPGLPFQTVPDDVRSMFIADPGHVFIGFDYEQAEAFVVAVLSYNHELLEDLLNRIDIHTKLAAMLPFGKTYDELMAEIATKGKDKVRERVIAKTCRHALNYIEGAGTFQLTVNKEWLDTGIGIGATEAQSMRNQYLEINSGLMPWWEEVKVQMRTDKYIDNSFGRRRMVLGRITEDSHREMVSYYPQSTVADLCTQSIVKVARKLPYAQVLLHMHDGGMFQVPYERREEAYGVMMEEVVWPIRVKNEMLTIPAEGKMGYTWGDMGKPF